MLNTVTELEAYTEIAEKYFHEDERQEIVDYLAKNPKKGDVIPGTNGLRKLRWGKDNKGKSGGVRIIYYIKPKTNGIKISARFAEKLSIKSSNLIFYNPKL